MIPQDKTQNFTSKLRKFTDIRVLSLLAFAVVAILITWSGLNVAKTNYELEKKISELEQQVAVQKLENQNMKLKNQHYKSNQYLELAARSKFNKAAPGEKLYLVPESVEMDHTVKSKFASNDGLNSGEENKPKYKQNFDAWMRFLFNSGPSNT